MSWYVDTSALAKWYIAEPGSVEFAAFAVENDDLSISRLCVVELRCLLARRRRAGSIDQAYEMRAYRRFLEQLASGYLAMFTNTDEHLGVALTLIETLAAPLRALDALHLAAAGAAGCTQMATGDRVMQKAAGELGMAVTYFGSP